MVKISSRGFAHLLPVLFVGALLLAGLVMMSSVGQRLETRSRAACTYPPIYLSASGFNPGEAVVAQISTSTGIDSPLGQTTANNSGAVSASYAASSDWPDFTATLKITGLASGRVVTQGYSYTRPSCAGGSGAGGLCQMPTVSAVLSGFTANEVISAQAVLANCTAMPFCGKADGQGNYTMSFPGQNTWESMGIILQAKGITSGKLVSQTYAYVRPSCLGDTSSSRSPVPACVNPPALTNGSCVPVPQPSSSNGTPGDGGGNNNGANDNGQDEDGANGNGQDEDGANDNGQQGNPPPAGSRAPYCSHSCLKGYECTIPDPYGGNCVPISSPAGGEAGAPSAPESTGCGFCAPPWMCIANQCKLFGIFGGDDTTPALPPEPEPGESTGCGFCAPPWMCIANQCKLFGIFGGDDTTPALPPEPESEPEPEPEESGGCGLCLPPGMCVANDCKVFGLW